MSNQIVNATEQLKCFGCGKEITFKGSRIRYNLDGSVHVCKPEDKEQYKQQQGSSQSSSKSSRNSRQNRWYWGFGPGKYHKDNEKRYSGEEYKQRRKAAEENYNNYKQKYTSHTNISESKALEVLGLTKDILTKKFEEKLQEIKKAFRVLALRFHPDRKPEGNTEKFREVNEAYEFLLHRNGVK